MTSSHPGVVCAGCGAANSRGSRFCTDCGKAMSGIICSRCGDTAQSGARFCAQCGNTL
ncbi:MULTISPECIES: zinc ribbon domain-containing protein [Ralstonia]|uniref:zinc ribbon domain-containing protein n=1 Tax=Ralstonia TaxID=48736 RepID=UPI0020183C04|nr:MULTISPECIES: zinc ribbon domain-containing protein [Ralstonia]